MAESNFLLLYQINPVANKKLNAAIICTISIISIINHFNCYFRKNTVKCMTNLC